MDCGRCAKKVVPGAPDSHVYTDADGTRVFHRKCVPPVIVGRCYVCQAPTQQDMPFIVYFVKLGGWAAERGVCHKDSCRQELVREAQEEGGINVSKWCLACRDYYDPKLAACPRCGKQ